MASLSGACRELAKKLFFLLISLRLVQKTTGSATRWQVFDKMDMLLKRSVRNKALLSNGAL